MPLENAADRIEAPAARQTPSRLYPTVQIDDEFKTILRPQTADERSRLKEKILAEGGADPASIKVAAVDGRKVLLDGHNTHAILEEIRRTREGFPIPRLRLIDLPAPTREAAKRWIVENQQGRRNLSPSELAQLRVRRMRRMMKLREEGKSLRAIAEEEGVSVAQVQRDLASASEAAGQPIVSRTGRVEGSDGRSRPATVAMPDPPPSRRNGSAVDWNAVSTGTRSLMGALESLYRAAGLAADGNGAVRQDSSYNYLTNLVNEYLTGLRSRFKELTGQDPPDRA